MKAVSKKAKSRDLLRQVGLWATIWWGVSGFYIVLLVWLAKDYYVQRSGGGFSAWQWSIDRAYSRHDILQSLITVIVLGWIIGGVVWLKALRRAGISYKAGLKDLLLTIR